MFTLPLFTELQEANNILIAGAGGGYDIFSGLPLYFALKAAGKNVHLANLSFSLLGSAAGQRLSPSMLEVTADLDHANDYFPEKYLSEWFRIYEKEEVSIHCFERTGVKPLLANYQILIEQLSLDTIILVDGGTDSLMRGDEDGLGTPQEDITSITAVNELNIKRKVLICLGFGVDHYHGVSNALSFEAIAELTRNKGFLGMFSLHEDMTEVKKYCAATNYVFKRMPQAISIVSSSILAALAGHYGDYHATDRTQSSKLWINPLMPVYWSFRLDKVAERIMYLEAMKETEDYMDVQYVLAKFRAKLQGAIRKRHEIPN
jgi:hypothetical protein